jgi:hypothetical protein
VTLFTDVTIIVVKPSLQQGAEAAAIAADPGGGAGTFVPGVPLRAAGDATNTVVAYWCRWNMKPSQRSTFAQTIGGPNNIIAKGGNVPAFTSNRDRWFFDASAAGWTGGEVLAALGLAPLGLPPMG